MGPHTSRSGDPVQDVLDALRRIVQTLRESSRLAEHHVGLSGAQLFVLEQLAAAPALSLNELAARTHTHQSSVSTVVSRLVERGLVTRKPAKADGRRVELAVSAAGRKRIARTPGAAQDRLIRSITALSPAARRQLAAGLAALVRGMDADHGKPPMFFNEPHDRRRDRQRNA